MTSGRNSARSDDVDKLKKIVHYLASTTPARFLVWQNGGIHSGCNDTFTAELLCPIGIEVTEVYVV